jgi:hypothetical protein
MTSTARNTLVIVIAVVVLIVLFFMFRDEVVPNNTDNSSNSTTTVSVNGTDTSTNGTNGVNGTNANVGAATTLVNNAVALNSLLDTALVRVPNTGVDVALTRGEATFTNGTAKGTVKRGPILGKVQTNDGYDVFTDMTIVMENTVATIHYVALFQVMGSAVSYTSAAVVGDRLLLQSVTARADANATVAPSQIMSTPKGYILTVNYLDRANGQAMTTAPSIAKTLDLRVKGHLISR